MLPLATLSSIPEKEHHEATVAISKNTDQYPATFRSTLRFTPFRPAHRSTPLQRMQLLYVHIAEL